MFGNYTSYLRLILTGSENRNILSELLPKLWVRRVHLTLTCFLEVSPEVWSLKFPPIPGFPVSVLPENSSFITTTKRNNEPICSFVTMLSCSFLFEMTNYLSIHRVTQRKPSPTWGRSSWSLLRQLHHVIAWFLLSLLQSSLNECK